MSAADHECYVAFDEKATAWLEGADVELRCEECGGDMTEIDLDTAERLAREAKERAERATPGLWHVDSDSDDRLVVYRELTSVAADAAEAIVVADWGTLADILFIAAARTDVPALADFVLALTEKTRTLEAENQRLTRERNALGVQLGRVLMCIRQASLMEYLDVEALAIVHEAKEADNAYHHGALSALLDRWDEDEKTNENQ